MPKVTSKGFYRTDFPIEPPPTREEITEGIIQTLTRLIGWDEDSSLFRLLTVDSDGRLLISTSPTQTANANTSKVAPDTSDTTVLNANPTRKQYTIYNNGSVTVYITFGTTVDTSIDFPLPAGGLISDNVYTGVITGKTASGTGELRIIEM